MTKKYVAGEVCEEQFLLMWQIIGKPGEDIDWTTIDWVSRTKRAGVERTLAFINEMKVSTLPNKDWSHYRIWRSSRVAAGGFSVR